MSRVRIDVSPRIIVPRIIVPRIIVPRMGVLPMRAGWAALAGLCACDRTEQLRDSLRWPLS